MNDTKTIRYKSPLRWPGGKTRAITRLHSLMPDLSTVKDYREPMVGGGSVFLHIRNELAPGGYVWINDLFKPLYSFWMAVQGWPNMLCEELCCLLALPDKKEVFQEIKQNKPEHLTPGQLFLINRCAFSGNLTGGFSASASHDRFTASSVKRILLCHPALKDACITNHSFEEVIRGSGSISSTFIFLDPPYYGIKGLYNIGGKGEFDHINLEFWLRKCRYPFMLTYNDCPEVRELYNWADIQPLNVQYGMDNVGGNKPKQGQELIIRNYA